ncbi:MAG TPA: DMT family transporter [Terriglobales bacterium]|nr:DMT family transporter [Terriglobales bacterium]
MQVAQLTAAQPRTSVETLAYLGLLGTTLCWASAFIAGKVVLRETTPLTAASLRYAIAALALLPFAWRSRPPLAAVRRVWPAFLVMALGSGVLYPWLFFEALARTEAANCSLLIALNPLFTVLLSPLIGEKRHRRWGGILLAMFGAALVITRGETANIVRFAQLSFATGDLLALGAAAVWAGVNLASRPVATALPSSFINFLVFAFGAACLMGLTADEQPLAQLTKLSGAGLSALMVMAVLASVLSGQLFLFGVRTVGVNRTVVFIYLVPVLTALLSLPILGEAIGAAQVAGGAAVLAGVWWTTRR